MSDIRPISYDKYSSYLLSKNICQILDQFDYKTIDKDSLFLLTNVTMSYIESLAIKAKSYTELSGRIEVNLIDLFFTLIQRGIEQKDIIDYIARTSIKSTQNFCVFKQYQSEESKRVSLLKRLNSTNVNGSVSINKAIVPSIPKNLRYFPRDFALKSTNNTIELNEGFLKKKKEIKSIEKKSIEDIISSNSYYDMNKKQSRHKAIDIMSIFNEISKTANEDNMSFGKRFKMKEDEVRRKDKNDNNNNIEPIGDKPFLEGGMIE